MGRSRTGTAFPPPGPALRLRRFGSGGPLVPAGGAPPLPSPPGGRPLPSAPSARGPLPPRPVLCVALLGRGGGALVRPCAASRLGRSSRCPGLAAAPAGVAGCAGRRGTAASPLTASGGLTTTAAPPRDRLRRLCNEGASCRTAEPEDSRTRSGQPRSERGEMLRGSAAMMPRRLSSGNHREPARHDSGRRARRPGFATVLILLHTRSQKRSESA